MLTLTPQARAIAAITLGFLFVDGGLFRLGGAIVNVFSTDVSSRTHTQAVLIVMIVVGAAILLLARSAVALADGWAKATAQAAQLVIVIGIGMMVIGLLATVLHDNPSGVTPFLFVG